MVKKIIWTSRAQQERKDIFDYWNFRNQSFDYSIKLNELIKQTVDFLSQHPKTGRVTENENLRMHRIQNYLLFYEETESEIYIVSFWDGRQDPERLRKRLE
jgi:toxin YoeB